VLANSSPLSLVRIPKLRSSSGRANRMANR